MSPHYSGTKFFRTILSLTLLLGFLNVSVAQTVGHAQDQDPGIPTDGILLYLPAVMNGLDAPNPPLPRPGRVFGLEAEGLGDLMMDISSNSNTYWVRHFEISWKKIEPTEPNPDHTYDWSKVWSAGIENVSERGLNLIALVSFAPEWAQMDPPGVDCGPIDPDHLDEFAEFMGALVERYSAEPYNVKYFEIGSEPDDIANPAWPDPPHGCWGDPNKPFYGGAYYGEMLNHVYPAVKAANPEAQVIIGGLLMGCDTRSPLPDCGQYKSTFFEGILNNPISQPGDNFDIAGVHGYGVYLSNGTIYDDPVPHWPYGGIIFGKVDFLKYVMSNYYVDKPIMITEASLICNNSLINCPSSTYYQRQADYAVKLFARAWADDRIYAASWYSLYTDWRHSAMMYESGSDWLSRPVFDAYEYMATRLLGFTLESEVTDYPGVQVQGYEFQNGSETIWVIWSQDWVAHNISVAGGPDVYDLFGALIQTNASSISVNRPIYIVWD